MKSELTTDIPDILLKQPLEELQIVNIHNHLVVVSSEDLLQIGSHTSFGEDFSSLDSVSIYAESLLLSEVFRLKKGVISAHSLTVAGKGVIDASGKPGDSKDTPNEHPDEKGLTGGNGKPGGDLSIYVEMTESQPLNVHVSANGGLGGEGQRGTLSTIGGDGGSGGDGGQVIVLTGSPYLVWLSKLKGVNQLQTVEEIQQGIKELLDLIPNSEGLSGVKESLTEISSPADATIEHCQKVIENVSFQLLGLIATWNNSVQSSIDVSGGDYGVYGEGKINGDNGHEGKPGILQHINFDEPLNVMQKSFSPFMMIHPSQCTRLLEKIKLMYLTIDPVNNPQGVKDIAALLLRLQSRTALFDQLEVESELAKFYNEHEYEIGAIGAISQLRSVYSQTNNYLDQLAKGKNLFGFDSSHVPLASFAFYNDTLDKLIDNFGKLQIEYNNYFEQLKNNQADMEHIKRARETLSVVKTNAQEDLQTLKETLLKTATVIDSYQTIIPLLKQRVTDAIEGLEEDIQSYFDFNYDNLFQALTSLAFAPESGFMISVLTSEFVYKGTTKIMDDKDLPVNKEYLVREIRTVQADIKSLEEGYQALNNGTLTPEDPSAGRLITTAKQLFSFLDDFYGKFPHQLDDLKKVFKDYISHVIERNNKILTYNAIVLLMLRNHELIESADDRCEELNDEVLNKLSPDLPDLVSFMSSSIYTARNQIMEVLDLTARAYRFWSLSDHNPLTNLYGNKTLPQMNYATLLSIKNNIMIDYQQAVERFGTNHSDFPHDPNDQGLIYELPSYQVEILKLVKHICVKIPTVTQGTTLQEGNIFAKMANVRVRLVRVWIDGAKTANNQLRVHLTHSGDEEITSQSGEVFAFSHAPVSKPFFYHLDTGKVMEEANFGMEEDKTNYAALGPFTQWNISVSDDDNASLDLSGVTGIRLEFHGTNYDFDSNKKEDKQK
ncbi:hypothetical protein NQ117_02150 [Paenibacillus sp. SC116]|uniref:hypothetical protein n=1 Tax=Paenibacillus sp. SC116 TaxID=2968986 RepID=UPI00215B4D9E|nr:hypothetical protein [Paenibacillus sp. SC116]MCR8842474.1 hypothetical protein [Paenibacillus sp. SC116]